MLPLQTEKQRPRIGDVAGTVVWAISLTSWVTAMALRNARRLTIDQFTMMCAVVTVVFAFGIYIRARLNKQKLDPWRRWLCIVIVLNAVGIGGYKAILDATAEKRVTKVCVALTPGMSVPDVKTIAEAHGMYSPRDGATIYFIGEKATANQFGCLLKFKERILASSTYQSDTQQQP